MHWLIWTAIILLSLLFGAMQLKMASLSDAWMREQKEEKGV